MPGKSKKGGGLETKKSSFYLKSSNTTPFKMKGGSPLKQSPISPTKGETYAKYLKRAFELSKSPEGRDVLSKKLFKAGKKVVKTATKGATRANILTLMLGASKTAKADQPKKGKGKREYPGGKIDFTK